VAPFAPGVVKADSPASVDSEEERLLSGSSGAVPYTTLAMEKKQSLFDPMHPGEAPGGGGLPGQFPTLPLFERAAAAERAAFGAAERATQIHGALDAIAQEMRTTAVLETSAGRIVASGGPDLNPAQRALLQAGETFAKWPGAHAEVTALGEA